MTMAKLIDWETRLAAYVADVMSKPFAWGEHDCCLWAAGVAQAQTGQDLAAPYRGTYSDEHGAAQVLRKLRGLKGVGDGLGSPIAPAFSTNGDIGIIRAPSGKRVMALFTGHVWLFVTARGLQVAAPDRVIHAWRVGHA